MTFRVTERHTHGEVSIMSRKSRVNIPKICFKMTSNKIVHNFQQNTPQFNTAEQELSALMSYANKAFAKNEIPMFQSHICQRQV